MKVLIIGEADFIGSYVLRALVTQYPDYRIVNVDALTYADNLENLEDTENTPNYHFEKADIADETAVNQIFEQYRPDGIIHLATESYVDKSIRSPLKFVKTVEKRTGLKIACLEEIALRYRWITKDQLQQQLEGMKGDYFEYLKTNKQIKK